MFVSSITAMVCPAPRYPCGEERVQVVDRREVAGRDRVARAPAVLEREVRPRRRRSSSGRSSWSRRTAPEVLVHRLRHEVVERGRRPSRPRAPRGSADRSCCRSAPLRRRSAGGSPCGTPACTSPAVPENSIDMRFDETLSTRKPCDSSQRVTVAMSAMGTPYDAANSSARASRERTATSGRSAGRGTRRGRPAARGLRLRTSRM